MMNLGLVISLLLIFGALYFAGLVGYRLWLSFKGFQSEQQKLSAKLLELQEPIERDFEPAVPSSSLPAIEVLAKREQFLRVKQHRAQERRRRLVQRLQTLDLDKR